MIESNLIYQLIPGVKKLLFLGSSCIYPKFAPQPIRRNICWTASWSPPTNPMPWPRSPASRCARPTTGNMAPNSSPPCPPISMAPRTISTAGLPCDPGPYAQVPPGPAGRGPGGGGLGQRHPGGSFSTWTIWPTPASFDGALSGERHRQRGGGPGSDHPGVGRNGARVTGFKGRLSFDPSQPDGTPRKLLDVSRLTALGWQARFPWKKVCAALTNGFAAAVGRGRAEIRRSGAQPPRNTGSLTGPGKAGGYQYWTALAPAAPLFHFVKEISIYILCSLKSNPCSNG